jgi:hypothetical protein
MSAVKVYWTVVDTERIIRRALYILRPFLVSLDQKPKLQGLTGL